MNVGCPPTNRREHDPDANDISDEGAILGMPSHPLERPLAACSSKGFGLCAGIRISTGSRATTVARCSNESYPRLQLVDWAELPKVDC
jgi:hypothetical protein